MTDKPKGAPIPQKYPEEVRDAIFELRYVQDKTHKEIAELLKMPLPSVQSVLSYDISRLRAYSKALIKHKRKYKLNLASDKTLTLLLTALEHIENKFEKATSGKRPMDNWELNSFSKTLVATYKVIEEARLAGKLNTKDPMTGSYNDMKRAQVIDVNDIANLPDESPVNNADSDSDPDEIIFEQPVHAKLVEDANDYDPDEFKKSLLEL